MRKENITENCKIKVNRDFNNIPILYYFYVNNNIVELESGDIVEFLTDLGNDKRILTKMIYHDKDEKNSVEKRINPRITAFDDEYPTKVTITKKDKVIEINFKYVVENEKEANQ